MQRRSDVLLIGINELRPGLRVHAAVMNPTALGRPLLNPGAILTEPVITSLGKHGVRQVWVEHTLTNDLDEPRYPDPLRAKQAVHALLTTAMPRPANCPPTGGRVSACRRVGAPSRARGRPPGGAGVAPGGRGSSR